MPNQQLNAEFESPMTPAFLSMDQREGFSANLAHRGSLMPQALTLKSLLTKQLLQQRLHNASGVNSPSVTIQPRAELGGLGVAGPLQAPSQAQMAMLQSQPI